MKKESIKNSAIKKNTKKVTVVKKRTKGSWKNSMTPEQWQNFYNMKDADVNTSDIPEISADMWQNAKVVMPKNKKAISLRIDEDMLSWFRKHGKGYQSFMNSVLRSYYETHHKDA